MGVDRSKERLVRLPEVVQRTSLSRTTIYRKIESGTFPRQMRLSGGMVVWYEGDIDAWIADPVRWRAPD